jgi:hypothetical protein
MTQRRTGRRRRRSGPRWTTTSPAPRPAGGAGPRSRGRPRRARRRARAPVVGGVGAIRRRTAGPAGARPPSSEPRSVIGVAPCRWGRGVGGDGRGGVGAAGVRRRGSRVWSGPTPAGPARVRGRGARPRLGLGPAGPFPMLAACAAPRRARCFLFGHLRMPAPWLQCVHCYRCQRALLPAARAAPRRAAGLAGAGPACAGCWLGLECVRRMRRGRDARRFPALPAGLAAAPGPAPPGPEVTESVSSRRPAAGRAVVEAAAPLPRTRPGPRLAESEYAVHAAHHEHGPGASGVAAVAPRRPPASG